MPLSHPDAQLAVWVRNQRHQYRHLINGRYSSLTPERIQKLDDIDFDWGTPAEVAWRHRYEELVQYKKVHGHCNVPELWDENPALGQWVVQQRVRYRNLMAGRKPDICEDRIKALAEIGFEWDFFGSKWSEMLERTRVILSSVEDNAEENDGDHDKKLSAQTNYTSPKASLLSDECNRDVRVWIDVQRYHYARLQRGQSSPLTPERIQRLESIPGFKWIRYRRRSHAESSRSVSTQDWSNLFEEAKKVDVEAALTGVKNIDDDLDWDREKLEDLWAMEDD